MPSPLFASLRLAPTWPAMFGAPADIPTSRPAAPRSLEAESTGDAARILVVDDSPSIHEDFRKILSGEDACGDLLELEMLLFDDAAKPSSGPGFELTVCDQGQSGLDAVRQQALMASPFALAFVDVRMPPGWDGIETTRRIWEVDPHLPVVLCTAYADHTWAEIARALGPDAPYLILKKPFDTAEVRQICMRLSSWSRKERLLSARVDALAGSRDALANARAEAAKLALGFEPLLTAARAVVGSDHAVVEALHAQWQALMGAFVEEEP